jgi:hypothetical protein
VHNLVLAPFAVFYRLDFDPQPAAFGKMALGHTLNFELEVIRAVWVDPAGHRGWIRG